MALIDKTYFVAELDIPNTNKPDVAARLNLFIEKYEEKFLRELLGYDLYTAFVAGIQEDPMPAIWNNLLFGAGEWQGLIRLDAGVEASLITSGDVDIVVGRGGAYDPVHDSNSTIIPPGFVGRSFQFIQRGFGPFRADELVIVDNVLTLPEGWTFNDTDTYFYHAPVSIRVASAEGHKSSIIANYVYYWWMRDTATKTMGIGEGKPQMENARMTDNMHKQVRAWNEMVEGVHELYDYLGLYPVDYPYWLPNYRYWTLQRGRRVRNDLAYPINTFNL